MCTVKCGGIMLTYLVSIATDVNPTSICLTPTSTQKTVMYLCSSVKTNKWRKVSIRHGSPHFQLKKIGSKLQNGKQL
jgi:hypothetical protein